MDQIQRATLSLAICVFSAVTSVFGFFFFVGFSGGLLPPAALERGYYTYTFIHRIIFPVPALLFSMFIANFLSIHIRV